MSYTSDVIGYDSRIGRATSAQLYIEQETNSID